MPTLLSALLVLTPCLAIAALACCLGAKPGAKSLGHHIQAVGASLTLLSVIFVIGGVCLLATVTEEPEPGQGLQVYRLLHIYLPFFGALSCFYGGLSLWLAERPSGST